MAKKVLIVDDSNVVRRLQELLVSQLGCVALHASDGAEAMRVAIEEKPDLILLDIQMPIMDGTEVLGALRARPETKNLPIVIVSTIGRSEDRDLLIKGGATDFVPKPIDTNLLMKTVVKLLYKGARGG